MQKGQTPLLILVGILIIVAVAGGAYYLGRSSDPKPSPNPVITSPASTQRGEQTPQTTPIKDASPAPTGAGETANWKTYTSGKLTFKYPSHILVREDYPGMVSIFVDVDPNYQKVGNYDDIYIDTRGNLYSNLNEAVNDHKQPFINPKIENLGNVVKISGEVKRTGGEGPVKNFTVVIQNGSEIIFAGVNDYTGEGKNQMLFDQILSTFRFD